MRAGLRVALVTVLRVSGASVRNPGAHMAVAENGVFQGSLSGGCIEAAVVGEALSAIREGNPRVQVYGAGSPLIDIRLPCGGTVELLFSPLKDAEIFGDDIKIRRSVSFGLPLPNGQNICVSHAPPLRLTIIGHGGTVDALAQLAQPFGAEVAILTPDREIAARWPAVTSKLHSVEQDIEIPSDPWTSISFLFHDHDWEAPLLIKALAAPALMIGAMGSHKTHAARIQELRVRGLHDHEISRIKAPIGLIPSSRDPETLALSILAEAVAAYNATNPTQVTF